jgi:hypothetical protein
MTTPSNNIAPAVNGQSALIMLMATLSETQKDNANNNLKLTNIAGALDVTVVNNMADQIGLSYDAQVASIRSEAAAAYATGATSLCSSGLHFKSTFHTGGEDGIMSNQLKALKNEIFVENSNGPQGQHLPLAENEKNALIRSNGLDRNGKALELGKSYSVDNEKLVADQNGRGLREILAGADEDTKTALNEALKLKMKEVDRNVNHSIDRYKRGAEASHAVGQSTAQGVSGTMRAESTLAQKNADQTRAKEDNAKSLTEQVQQSNQAAAKDSMDKMSAALELARLADGINSLRG